jgi:uncharacterized membrane protein YhhN
MLPFAGGMEQTENGLMVFALLAALLYLFRPSGTFGGKWAIIKTIPVAFLAVIAWYQSSPLMLVAALVLSAIGDYLLAHEGERFFLGGLVAFFLAHVAYAILFVSSGVTNLFDEPWRIAVAFVFLAHAALMAWRLNTQVPADMRIPVFAYIGVISLMGLSATAYGTTPILLGVMLFIVSDTLLAIGRFLMSGDDNRQSIVQPGVWVTYIAAQSIILLAVLGKV